MEVSLPEIIESLMRKIDSLDSNQGEESQVSDIVKKNVISGPGSTFERKEPPKTFSTLTADEKRRLYQSGTEIARAFADYERKATKSEDREVATPNIGASVDIKPTELPVKTKDEYLQDQPKYYFMGWHIARAFYDFNKTKQEDTKEKNIIQQAKEKVKPIIFPTSSKEGEDKSNGSGSALGSALGGLVAGIVARSALGRLVRSKVAAVKRVGAKIRSVRGAAAAKMRSAGRVIARGAKAGRAGAVGRAITKVAGTAKVASAMGALGTVGRVASKVAGPLAIAGIAVDAGLAIKNLTSEAGRDRLRQQAQELDFRKNFWSTTGKVLLNPIQTITAAGLSIGDYFKSMRGAAEAEERLKNAEIEGVVKRDLLLEKYDLDKSGDLNTEEKIARFREENRLGFIQDGDKKYRYDPKTETVSSMDKKVEMSVDEFLKLQDKAVPIEKETAPPMITKEVIAVPLEKPPIADNKPVVNVELDDQNNLIVNQTRVMVEILNANKQLIGIAKQQQNGNNIVNNTIVPSPTMTPKSEINNGVDARGLYLSSPYSLSPT